MFKYQIKQFASTVLSSVSIAFACASCIFLLILDVEGVEARLIWIPRTKDIKEGSAEHHKMVNKKEDKLVNKKNYFDATLNAYLTEIISV